MTPKLIFLFFFIAFVYVAKATTTGTDEEGMRKSDVMGGVYSQDSRKPLNSVSVTVYLAAKKEKVVLTNEDGMYALTDLKAGTYKFVFEKDGYKKVIKEKVVVQPYTAAQLDIEMAEHATFEMVPGPFHFSDFD